MNFTGPKDATATVGAGETDTLKNIENIKGGSGNDTFNLGKAELTDREIDGGTGNNTVDYSGFDGTVKHVGFNSEGSALYELTSADGKTTVTHTLTGINTVKGAGGDDSLKGSANNDTLEGTAGNDVLEGGAGDDVLTGGAGNDILKGGAGNDTLNGDGGVNTADYGAATGDISVNLSTTGPQAIGAGQGSDTLNNIDNLVGGSGNDTLTGNENANTISGSVGNDVIDGGSGDDVLNGGAGDDTLKGGAGSDTLNGGAGTDTADYSDQMTAAQNTLTVKGNKEGLTASVGTGETDTLNDIENIKGGSRDDTFNLGEAFC